MIPSVRAKRHALKISRQGPFLTGDNFTTPVYNDDGSIRHYKCNPRPDYVNRKAWRTKRSIERETLANRMWEADHALSSCCGKGKNEYGEVVYAWLIE